MSLLHATWLPAMRTGSSHNPGLLIWADSWRVAKPSIVSNQPVIHPFALSAADLRIWLLQKKLLPKESIECTALLTLPSKSIKNSLDKKLNGVTDSQNTSDQPQWSGLPLQAGEPVTKQCEWWPWQVEGIAIKPSEAASWLANLPLTKKDPELSEEILWWSHLERWSLSLIARGLWLPQVELNTIDNIGARARWSPLLNNENERKRLEEFSIRLPLVATCAIKREETSEENQNHILKTTPRETLDEYGLAVCRPINSRLQVAYLLEELVDGQLRKDFEESSEDLDPLLKAWQEALGSHNGVIRLPLEDCERLAKASKNWKENLSGNVKGARACLELFAPLEGEDLWDLQFSLQAEADPSLKVAAEAVWNADSAVLQIGDIQIAQPGEILLEGLGRALNIFQPIERGLENATPNNMQLTPAEAFVLVRTASKQLRDIGIGVILPRSLSGGLASRLGIAIKAELATSARGLTLRENLEWSWELMIGGSILSLKDLEQLASKRSPLVRYKDSWLELRPNDLKIAEKFCSNNPELSLDDALRLTATKGETLMKLPVHQFNAGPKLQGVLEQYHQHTSPEPLAAPDGFYGQLRPYQERGIGWLAFLHRFNQGACLADDMGLGKTIQVLAFIQHLKSNKDLKKPVLLIAPTSVLTNWKREAYSFTPELSVLEHYGPNRSSTSTLLKKILKKVDILITSYGLLHRDKQLLKTIDWQGVIIDEAQAIKNPNSKQSQTTREIVKGGKIIPFRIALTGTPIENRVSELWSLMDFLNPSVLGEKEFFDQRYKLPIERYGDISSLTDLKARVSPFILRRLKSDKSIISDLPSKVELKEWITLSQEQRALYNKTVDNTLQEIARSPIGQRHAKTLGLLTRLKQICNHPALALKEKNISDDFGIRSTKLQRLEELLDVIFATEDRALLFTQFAEWGHLLQAYLEKKWGHSILFLHGGTRKIDRQSMVDQFQEDPRGPKLFLLSLKAGGIGLNLTRANHVLHIDRWWNPAVENQATDRAYRIGQKNSVMVHKFIATGSVEEKIDQMITEKSKLAENIIGAGEDWLGKLGINELRELVSLEKES
ncbi:DEAD/DEAH box helicase [Prochlorococcus marinus]|uniref:Superfamily II DNA/RNA helicase, SNF2 family n=1 Tax=Prochlorococcus marinus (strain MIT 9211) TaxID=93059 RepID=A9B9E4_PROM4|nr:DEAD/DEAH box helicase [Prochlorococcus marinus]ABX07981.1 Superfamily II DNA/RNA helicase, SNF2 family [Prochlorococcus marinus str. MIT 9211]